MVDFLSTYSIQKWLESCPQGYLEGHRLWSAPMSASQRTCPER